MTHVDMIRRRLRTLTFLEWLPGGLMFPVVAPLLLERGVDPVQIGMIFAVHAIVSAGFELPAGLLADLYGRKPVALCGAITKTVGLGVLALGAGLGAMVAAGALIGASRAALSGTAESWFVDQASPAPEEVPRGLAGAEAGLGTGIASGALAGGLLPLAGPQAGISATAVPIALACALAAVHGIAIAVLMTGPPHRRTAGASPGNRAVFQHFGDTIRRPAVRAVLYAGCGAGMVAGALETLWPVSAIRLLGAQTAPTFYSVVIVCGMTLSAFAATYLTKIAQSFGPVRIVLILMIVAAVGCATLMPLASPVALAAAFVTFHAALAGSTPTTGGWLHSMVTDDHRASTVSAVALSGAIGAGIGATAVPAIAGTHGEWFAWVTVAGAFLLASLPLILRYGPRLVTPEIHSGA
ncbi:hypothetical protein GCM10009555_068970 [Acrocarpospora macrocephala]|uniref:Major facilitator superfamily (MFS) profile domain-containing protein n=2 Tax=Acrocarpospora macrocephala TaxID=150177 RepID=A0A5M3X2R0_9ACTN|nr:hypothetical protein Amac_096250 [Acrocarpospora macrocephala]